MHDPVNVWAFEDAFRRLSTRLFTELHFDKARLARHELYRNALSDLFDGLMREDARTVDGALVALGDALPSPVLRKTDAGIA